MDGGFVGIEFALALRQSHGITDIANSLPDEEIAIRDDLSATIASYGKLRCKDQNIAEILLQHKFYYTLFYANIWMEMLCRDCNLILLCVCGIQRNEKRKMSVTRFYAH